MGIVKGYKKNCVGCNAYRQALEGLLYKDKGCDCRMHKKARNKCPCGICLVKVTCNRYCDDFYVVQIKENGVII
jgi:hypothetical protein